MKTNAVVSLRFSSRKRLQSFVDALLPEIKHPIGSRAKLNMETEDDFLLLSFYAGDTITLRSTLNAYLRWIGSVANVLELLDNFS